jgi:predicted nucleic acid-binding protein
LGVTSITWLEILRGAPGKNAQHTCKAILEQFEYISLTAEDQLWAVSQMEKYRLSHGIEINDCLIASIPHRLQIPIYTHNTHNVN